MNEEQLLDMLRELGRAIGAGDLPAVAACWALPALVLTDDGVIQFTDRRQLEGMFAGASDGYRSRGIAATRPEVLRIDRITGRLTAVDVRWPYLDAEDRVRDGEVSGYLVWADEAGSPRIRVAFSRSDAGAA